MNGLLVVDKPGGMTSHDVVAVCRRRLGVRRIGHAGTLDPDATGVLVIGVGRATRLLRFLSDQDKEYVADVVLGVETSTQDASGEILAEADASGIDETAVDAALGAFRGTILQVPPMVSAVKVGGEPLYRKARRGEEAERPAREVVIHALDRESFERSTRARMRLRVRCSKGTYVRTLAHDLGRALGVGGHVASLRRVASGPFRAEDAIRLDTAGPEAMLPMDRAAAGYPAHRVDAVAALRVVQGQRVPAAGIGGTYAVIGPSGLLAMAEDRGDALRTLCVVAGEDRP